MADEIQCRLAADGFADLRSSDGFVFQHLVEGPVTIGVLAERLDDVVAELGAAAAVRGRRMRAPR